MSDSEAEKAEIKMEIDNHGGAQAGALLAQPACATLPCQSNYALLTQALQTRVSGCQFKPIHITTR